MSLFAGLLRRRATSRSLSQSEAFAGLLLAAAACDGPPVSEEMACLHAVFGRMKLFQDLSAGRWRAMTKRLYQRLRHDGETKFVDRCAAVVAAPLRECLFANACDLILADGLVGPEERAFLEHLQRVLGLPGTTALNIVEVMIVKNKG